MLYARVKRNNKTLYFQPESIFPLNLCAIIVRTIKITCFFASFLYEVVVWKRNQKKSLKLSEMIYHQIRFVALLKHNLYIILSEELKSQQQLTKRWNKKWKETINERKWRKFIEFSLLFDHGASFSTSINRKLNRSYFPDRFDAIALSIR